LVVTNKGSGKLVTSTNELRSESVLVNDPDDKIQQPISSTEVGLESSIGTDVWMTDRDRGLVKLMVAKQSWLYDILVTTPLFKSA
jgi:hypothetical protein